MTSLFKDIFDTTGIDMIPDPKDPNKLIKSKKFDKTTRITATSENYGYELTLDVNTEIYPLRDRDKFELVLMGSLEMRGGGAGMGAGGGTMSSVSGAVSVDIFGVGGAGGNPEETHRYDLALANPILEEFEYVMHGKVFKYAEEKGRVVVYVSYGGLLMALKGESRILRAKMFEPDTEIYLMMRKVSS